jgi:hypothetical protein
LLPHKILVLAEPYPGRLSSARVASAIARGLRTTATYDVECHPREDPQTSAADPLPAGAGARSLDALPLAQARAVVLADHALGDGAPPQRAVFEIATRARQGGIPAYAVSGVRRPDLFQARMLDLQVVLYARGERALARAGEELGALV